MRSLILIVAPQRRAVDLIVVPGAGEARQFMDVGGTPVGDGREIDTLSFNDRRCGVQAGLLVVLGPNEASCIPIAFWQLLIERCAVCRVLDQKMRRQVLTKQLFRQAQEIGKLALHPVTMEKVIFTDVRDAPDGADAVIGAVMQLRRDVPAVNDLAVGIAWQGIGVRPKPDELHDGSALRDRRLQELRRECRLSHVRKEVILLPAREARRHQISAGWQDVGPVAGEQPERAGRLDVTILEAELRPATSLEKVAGEIILMEALHHDDDGAEITVVDAAEEGGIEPGIGAFTLDGRVGVGGVQRIVDDDEVGAAARQPETVIGWYRRGFRAFWRWKSRSRAGRSKTPVEIRNLIREMLIANPLWGAPRIHGELLKLGINVGQTTVAK